MNVSIIIPCFNHAGTLERAVRSALQQRGICEVIVVDDASTDLSLTVAHALAVAHDGIRVVRQSTNRGPGAARNRGVSAASGDFVCFLDADDELMDAFVEQALSMIQKSPQLVAVKCEMEFFDPIKGYILPSYDPRHQAAVLSSSCGMLIRREHFLRLGGFPEDPVFRGPAGGEDVAFMQAVMAHFQPIARLDKPGYRVWSQTGSHVDRFLARTRLTVEGGFNFWQERDNSVETNELATAIKQYLERALLAITG